MAKKTNKTDHVLNLLAGKDGAEETVGKTAEKTSASKVRVVDPKKDKDKVADAVKQMLEEELEEELEQKTSQEELPEEEAVEAVEASEAEAVVAEEAEVPEAAKEPAADEPAVEEDYAFLNIMEKLVREKVLTYMNQFGNCTCSRCVADVIALTLVHLPPKYVVVNRTAVAPLMNFYSKQFAGQITVEITKACMRVKECPHHDRD